MSLSSGATQPNEIFQTSPVIEPIIDPNIMIDLIPTSSMNTKLRFLRFSRAMTFLPARGTSRRKNRIRSDATVGWKAAISGKLVCSQQNSGKG